MRRKQIRKCWRNLIEREMKQGSDLETSVRQALGLVEGSYALAVVSMDYPDMLIAARQGSPLVIGVLCEISI